MLVDKYAYISYKVSGIPQGCTQNTPLLNFRVVYPLMYPHCSSPERSLDMEERIAVIIRAIEHSASTARKEFEEKKRAREVARKRDRSQGDEIAACGVNIEEAVRTRAGGSAGKGRPGEACPVADVATEPY